MLILISCTQIKQEAEPVNLVNVTCDYVSRFEVAESASNEELTFKARKNVFNPIGLDYDDVNQFKDLNCKSSGKKVICTYRSKMDCWWDDDSTFVNVNCDFPKANFVMKQDASAEAVTRKVFNTMNSVEYYDYLKKQNVPPGCAYRDDCATIDFTCKTSENVVIYCSENKSGQFGCKY